MMWLSYPSVLILDSTSFWSITSSMFPAEPFLHFILIHISCKHLLKWPFIFVVGKIACFLSILIYCSRFELKSFYRSFWALILLDTPFKCWKYWYCGFSNTQNNSPPLSGRGQSFINAKFCNGKGEENHMLFWYYQCWVLSNTQRSFRLEKIFLTGASVVEITVKTFLLLLPRHLVSWPLCRHCLSI